MRAPLDDIGSGTWRQQARVDHEIVQAGALPVDAEQGPVKSCSLVVRTLESLRVLLSSPPAAARARAPVFPGRHDAHPDDARDVREQDLSSPSQDDAGSLAGELVAHQLQELEVPFLLRGMAVQQARLALGPGLDLRPRETLSGEQDLHLRVVQRLPPPSSRARSPATSSPPAPACRDMVTIGFAPSCSYSVILNMGTRQRTFKHARMTTKQVGQTTCYGQVHHGGEAYPHGGRKEVRWCRPSGGPLAVSSASRPSPARASPATTSGAG